jgi:hypothetical protein
LRRTSCFVVAALLGIALLDTTSLANEVEENREDETLGWGVKADFSFVLTSGNSESTTLGLGSTARRKTRKSLLELRLGALEVETTSDLDLAIGTPEDFIVPERTETTAKTYFAAGKYDREISDRLTWYAGAGWLRNEPAGIADRYLLSGGLGHTWWDTATFSFRTNYGLSYTDQRDFVPIPLVSSSFAGVLLTSDLEKAFGKDRTEYVNKFLFNYSLADSENWRWSMEQWVSSSLTEKLSLKVTLTWLFNNVPAFREISLLEGDPPSDQGNTVLVQLEKLDTIFSVSLVVGFR